MTLLDVDQRVLNRVFAYAPHAATVQEAVEYLHAQTRCLLDAARAINAYRITVARLYELAGLPPKPMEDIYTARRRLAGKTEDKRTRVYLEDGTPFTDWCKANGCPHPGKSYQAAYQRMRRHGKLYYHDGRQVPTELRRPKP